MKSISHVLDFSLLIALLIFLLTVYLYFTKSGNKFTVVVLQIEINARDSLYQSADEGMKMLVVCKMFARFTSDMGYH